MIQEFLDWVKVVNSNEECHFDLHITVENNTHWYYESFAEYCAKIGIKTAGFINGVIPSYVEMMTVSKHKCSLNDMANIALNLYNYISKEYKVIRIKLEVDPKAKFFRDMKYYIETHTDILAESLYDIILLNKAFDVMHNKQYMMSVNVAKTYYEKDYPSAYKNTDVVISLTGRFKTLNMSNIVTEDVKALNDFDFNIGKTVVEVVVFDNNKTLNWSYDAKY